MRQEDLNQAWENPVKVVNINFEQVAKECPYGSTKPIIYLHTPTNRRMLVYRKNVVHHRQLKSSYLRYSRIIKIEAMTVENMACLTCVEYRQKRNVCIKDSDSFQPISGFTRYKVKVDANWWSKENKKYQESLKNRLSEES